MRRVPRWALISSGCAPVVLIGGWVAAGLLQGPGYDPVTQTISSLAAQGAVDRWLMSGALAVLGICHLVTALGLRAAALAGRVALAGGGVASVLVAFSPQPHHGASLRHGVVAGTGFALLSVWPLLSAGRSRSAPWGLRPVPALGATAAMLVGAAWFLVALRGHGPAGLVERLLTAAQTLWPLAVAVSCAHYASAAEARPDPARSRPGDRR